MVRRLFQFQKERDMLFSNNVVGFLCEIKNKIIDVNHITNLDCLHYLHARSLWLSD